jgi:tetratricopeptide (TPR) repeat protein
LPADSSQTAARPKPAAGWWGRFALVGAALALAAGTYTWLSRPAPVAFPQRGWILISSFENRTGEPLFNDTLELALQGELSNSQFVNAVPRERIQDTLLLMKRPFDTRLDASLAREVALRDGNVQIVLTGRTEKVASTYLLSASLIDPTTGVVLRSFNEQAVGQDAVLLAVRRLSNDVRRSLGEELQRVRHDNEALEKATTSSLRALHLYSQGMAFVNQGQWAAAAQLFEQALAVDSDFASAHIYLAHGYSNLGNEKHAAPHYQQALRLADSTANHERYFILGSYYSRFAKDDQKALTAYEVLVRLYPDHYWGVNNLANALSRLGRDEDAVPYLVARAELRPNDFGSNYQAWDASSRFGKDSPTTRRLRERILRLASYEPVRAAFPGEWAELQLLSATEHLERGELAQSLSEVDRIAGTLANYTPSAKTFLAGSVGDHYLALGRLRQDEELSRSLPADYRHLALAHLAEVRGDARAMRQHLHEQLSAADFSHGPATAARLARAGMLSESEQLISRMTARGFPKYQVDYARGELALARGQVPKAIRLLQASFDSTREKRRDAYALMTSETLARALEAQGDLTGAAQVLKLGTEYVIPINFAYVAQNRYQLLQLYRKLGRDQEARKTEAEIRAMLAVADADHPVLVALDRQRKSDRAGDISGSKTPRIVSKR